ncbi:DNA-binding anti-repressor SinI [Halobacillus sp. A5]|nr:anti-repressor SinI family protein [Halobacillus sp. A5]
MSTTIDIQLSSLDPEWIELMKEAKRLGLSVHEVKAYIRGNEESVANN